MLQYAFKCTYPCTFFSTDKFYHRLAVLIYWNTSLIVYCNNLSLGLENLSCVLLKDAISCLGTHEKFWKTFLH